MLFVDYVSAAFIRVLTSNRRRVCRLLRQACWISVSLLQFTLLPNALAEEAPEPTKVESRIQQQMEQARQLFLKGDLDGAIAHYDALIKTHPNHAEAYYRRGTATVYKGDFETGVRYIKRSIALDPQNLSLRFSLAGLLESRGDLDGAIAQYQTMPAPTAQAKDEIKRRLNLLLARKYIANNSLLAALQILTQLQRERPQDNDVSSELARVYKKLNRPEEAELALQRSIRMAPSAAKLRLQLARDLSERQLYQPMTEQLVAVIQQGRNGEGYQEAVNLAEEVAERLRQAKQTATAIEILAAVVQAGGYTAQTLAELGWLYAQNGQAEPAEATLIQAIKTDPNHVRARYYLAELLFALKRYSEAVYLYESIITLAPQGPEVPRARAALTFAYSDQGIRNHEEKKLEEARKFYEKALAHTPTHVISLFNLGLIFVTQNAAQEAVAYFQKVIDVEPYHVEAWKRLAQIKEALNDYEGAATALGNSIAFTKDETVNLERSAAYLIFLGARLSAQVGANSRAFRLLDEYISREPNDASAYNLAAALSSQWEEYRRAAKMYERSLQINPNQDGIRLRLAGVYEALWRDLSAQREYRWLIGNSPNKNVLNDAEERLEKLEKKIHGATFGGGFQTSFESNTNYNERNPRFDYRTALNVDVDYNYLVSERVRLKYAFKPAYSILHLTQFDQITTTHVPAITIGGPHFNGELGYTRDNIDFLSRDQSLNVADSLHIEANGRFLLPGFFGGLLGNRRNEPTPGNMQLHYRHRTFISATAPMSDARTHSLTGRLTVTNNAGTMITLGAALTQNEYAGNHSVYTDLLGADYSYRSTQFSVALRTTLSPGIFGVFNGSYTRYIYSNPDFIHGAQRICRRVPGDKEGEDPETFCYVQEGYFAQRLADPRFADATRYRHANLYMLSAGLFYRLNKYVTANMNYSLIVNRADLPAQILTDSQASLVTAAQATSLGSYAAQTVTFGLRLNY